MKLVPDGFISADSLELWTAGGLTVLDFASDSLELWTAGGLTVLDFASGLLTASVGSGGCSAVSVRGVGLPALDFASTPTAL